MYINSENITVLTERYKNAYTNLYSPLKLPYTTAFPDELKNSEVDSEGYIEWKFIKGTLGYEVYKQLEKSYKVMFPGSFMEWHKAFFFLDADASIIRLPVSNPQQP
jgi:hypothetical protein